MQDFQTILKSKRTQHGNTSAAIECAALEFALQYIHHEPLQTNNDTAIYAEPPKPVILEKCDVHEKGTLQWVFSIAPDMDDAIIVSEDYIPVITQSKGYTHIIFTRK